MARVPKQYVQVYVSLPEGSPAPAGYALEKSLRGRTIYKKQILNPRWTAYQQALAGGQDVEMAGATVAQPAMVNQQAQVIQNEMDQLAALLGGMGINPATAQVEVQQEDEAVGALAGIFSGLGFGGRRRKATKKTRKGSKKTRKGSKKRGSRKH